MFNYLFGPTHISKKKPRLNVLVGHQGFKQKVIGKPYLVLTLNTTPQFIHRRERLFGASGPLARELNANPLLTNVILNWGMYPGVLYNACNRFGVDRVLDEVRQIRTLDHVYSKGAYLRESFLRWGREAEIRACPPQPVPVTVDTFTTTVPVAVTPKEAIDAPEPTPSLTRPVLQPYIPNTYTGQHNPFRLGDYAEPDLGGFNPRPVNSSRAP